jgi:hypothetical protein
MGSRLQVSVRDNVPGPGTELAGGLQWSRFTSHAYPGAIGR